MSKDIEPTEESQVEESAEEVVALQDTEAEETDVQAHGSTVSLAACASVD